MFAPSVAQVLETCVSAQWFDKEQMQTCRQT